MLFRYTASFVSIVWVDIYNMYMYVNAMFSCLSTRILLLVLRHFLLQLTAHQSITQQLKNFEGLLVDPRTLLFWAVLPPRSLVAFSVELERKMTAAYQLPKSQRQMTVSYQLPKGQMLSLVLEWRMTLC